MLEIKKIPVHENANIKLDFELKKFDNSPSNYKKFLRTIARRYKIDKPIDREKNRSEFCERVVSSFFPSSQIKRFTTKEKVEVNKLIKARVRKAGGFLKVIEDKAIKTGEKTTDANFNREYREATEVKVFEVAKKVEGDADNSHIMYTQFEDGIDINESNGEIGYFYSEK